MQRMSQRVSQSVGQSTLAPESLTTGAHLAMSALINLPNSSDELGVTLSPWSSSRLRYSGEFSALFSSALAVLTTDAGSLEGPSRPNQVTASKPL